MIHVRDDISKKLAKLEQRTRSRRTMSAVASTVRALIVQRTLSGRDIHGRPFTPYSTTPIYVSVDNRPPGYPKPSGGRKSRTGRSVYYEGGYAQYKTSIGRGVRPQLSISQETLGDIKHRVTAPDRAILRFQTKESENKAAGHHFGSGNLPQREFFDIGEQKSEIAKIEGELVNLYRQYAGESGLRLV